MLFFDYLSLPQASPEMIRAGDDDRTDEEQEAFETALSGDTMGRIYLTSRVVLLDDIPAGTAHNTPYLDRGWSFFEASVAALNVFPRDYLGFDPAVTQGRLRTPFLTAEVWSTSEFNVRGFGRRHRKRPKGIRRV